MLGMQQRALSGHSVPRGCSRSLAAPVACHRASVVARAEPASANVTTTADASKLLDQLRDAYSSYNAAPPSQVRNCRGT
jgi:hypothetical protein